MLNRILDNLHKVLVPVVAVAALAFAIYRVVNAQQEKPPKPPFIAPAKAPFEKTVAGSGITEARTENIAIGAAVPGLVTHVDVKVGDVVRPGDVLFKIDDRAQQAEIQVRESMVAAARASLQRLENMPRTEEIKPSEFKVNEARARVAQAQDLFDRNERLVTERAISEQEMVQARQGLLMAKAIQNQLESQHELLLAGAWREDVNVADANVAQMQAELDKVKIDAERLQVRAPQTQGVKEYKVLQVNVRPGEVVGSPPSQALIVLGNVDLLHVRVDIDEYDIPRFDPQAKAVAKMRGDPKVQFPLTFVRIDPYVIPKKSLTGDNTERVDTRVLQVLYSLDKSDQPVYVGQQMDVFIEGK